jgi:adenylyltransferase/sulfurtransferase
VDYKDIQFSREELVRYNRHIIIPEFGLDAQRKLKASKVLVIGSGGLGSPALLYLAAAGVGTIGIVDGDVVEESNLHRQVLFGMEDVGESKVIAAEHRLHGLNHFINFRLYNTRLTSANVFSLLEEYDVIADGTDNFPTRYLVNDACVFLGKPYVYASIFQFDGQVTVFNYVNALGQCGPNYRDIFACPPPQGLVPSCAEGGVLGVLPGIIGSMQALEVIKLITGIGEILNGRLFTFDALSFETRIFIIKRDPTNPLNGDNPTIKTLIDYDQFCGVQNGRIIKEITAKELFDWKERGEDFQLIDVRDNHEFEEVNIGGDLIPLNLILDNSNRIYREKKVVIHCKSGARSARAIRELEDQFAFDNLYNLKGGILAYLQEEQLFHTA